jgi:hypothetical protein
MITLSSTNFFQDSEELAKRHEQACPPIEAYLFFPNDFQIIEFNHKHPSKTLRRIFESPTKKFEKYENDKLNELEEAIIQYNLKNPTKQCIIPDNYNLFEKRRYLQATAFEVKKTIDLLIDNIKWRKELIPPKINEKVIQLLNSGFMYIHGRDNNFRPIVVLQVKVYMELRKNFIYDDWLSTVIFFMEYLVNNMLIPGQVENWNIITDLEGVSILTLPSDMKKFMSILQSNYRCRLYVNYILGMGFFLRGIWSLVSKMLDETTIRKVRILSSSQLSEILSFINPEQLEKRFGGLAPDLVPGQNNLFPPVIPSKNFLTPSQSHENLLMPEDEYKELFKKGLIKNTHQYYLDKWKLEEEKEKEKIKLELLHKEKQIKEKIYIEKSKEIIETNQDFSNIISQVNTETTHSFRSKLKLQKNFSDTRDRIMSWVEDKNNHEHSTPEICLDLRNFLLINYF